MNENKDIIKEVEENGKKYTIQYFKGGKLERDVPTKKVIIVGLNGVGKSTISFRLITEEFKQCSPTISLDLAGYRLKVNDKIIQIQLWDSCGNDEFAANTPNLFKNTFIGILVYEIDKNESFVKIGEWFNLLKKYSHVKFIYLIGNKADLKNRQVETIEGEQLKKENNFKLFMETSALSGLNINNLLNKIAIDVYEDIKIEEEKEEEIEKNNGRINLEKEDLGEDKRLKKKKGHKKCC